MPQRGCAALVGFVLALLGGGWIWATIAASGLPGAATTGARWGLLIIGIGFVVAFVTIALEPGEGDLP